MKKILFLLILFFSTKTLYAQDNVLKFNHIYFVIDSVSFNKIKTDKEFFSLVNIDKGIPNFDKIDSTSTTLYLRGESTYIEIMGPNNKFNEKIGSIGLGFSWDTNDINNNDFSKKIINEANVKFFPFEAKRKFANEEVLWFTAFYTKLKGFISTWYAYYNPNFLSNLFQENHSIFTRELFLKKAYNRDKPITDLSEITINCSTDDFKKLTTELDLFYLKEKKLTTDSTIYNIDKLKLTLYKSKNNKSSLKSLAFKTKSEIDKKTKDFGIIEFKSINNKFIINFK